MSEDHKILGRTKDELDKDIEKFRRELSEEYYADFHRHYRMHGWTERIVRWLLDDSGEKCNSRPRRCS